MKTKDQLSELANIDGWRFENYGPVGYETLYWRLVKPDGTIRQSDMCGEDWVRSVCVGFYPNYPHSYDAIIPLIKKWVESHADHESQVNASTRFNYALTDTLDRANSHALEQYGYTYVQTILSTPAQLCEALLRVTGKWVE